MFFSVKTRGNFGLKPDVGSGNSGGVDEVISE
jgi:hypothetical protein